MSDVTYLAHHGIKGQKHGQRRWQNADGSLTPAGRIHYGVGAARSAVGSAAKSVGKVGKKAATAIRKKVAPTNVELNAQIRKEKSKILNKQKREELKRLKKTGELEDPKKKVGRKKYSEMSDEEINSRITRLKKEAELAELEMSKNFGPGKRMVIQAVSKGISTGIQTATQSGLKAAGETFIKRSFGVDEEWNKKQESKAKEESEKRAKQQAAQSRVSRAKKQLRQARKERKNAERQAKKLRAYRPSDLDQARTEKQLKDSGPYVPFR